MYLFQIRVQKAEGGRTVMEPQVLEQIVPKGGWVIEILCSNQKSLDLNWN